MKPLAALLIAAALSGGSRQAAQLPAAPQLDSAQAAPVRPAIAGIAHVAIQTSGLAKARAFYEGFLGFDTQQRKTSEGGTHGLGAGKFVHLRVPASASLTDSKETGDFKKSRAE